MHDPSILKFEVLRRLFTCAVNAPFHNAPANLLRPLDLVTSRGYITMSCTNVGWIFIIRTRYYDFVTVALGNNIIGIHISGTKETCCWAGSCNNKRVRLEAGVLGYEQSLFPLRDQIRGKRPFKRASAKSPATLKRDARD